ncbi:MAG: hypothetical protein LBC08_05175 [Campylobacteraceae bacterium]|jgi:hypothetical protein|nr:hypothetical protein [Campylobacteraceae bacterium]
MTSHEALLELDSSEFQNLSNELKLQRLEELSKNLSADASGSITILFSGNIDGQRIGDIAADIADKNPDARIISDTEIGKFLGDRKFQETLAETVGIDLNELRKGTVPPDLLSEYNSKLYNTDPSKDKLGFWSQASKRFVQETKGRVIILIGKDADPKKIFGSIEFQELMKNKSITHINNIPIDEFKKTLNVIPNQAITPKQIELLSESSSQILKTLNALKDKTTDIYNKESKIDKNLSIAEIYNQYDKDIAEMIKAYNVIRERNNNTIQELTELIKDKTTDIHNKDNKTDNIYNKEKDNNITNHENSSNEQDVRRNKMH